MRLNEALELLNNNGYKCSKMVPFLSLIEADDKGNKEITNAAHKAVNIIGQELKIQQKDEDDITKDDKKKLKDTQEKATGFMTWVNKHKWPKRLMTGVRILGIAMSVMGAAPGLIGDDTTQVNLDHGQIEISTDGIKYNDGDGKTLFEIDSNGKMDMADDISDEQMKNVSSDAEIVFDDYNIKADSNNSNVFTITLNNSDLKVDDDTIIDSGNELSTHKEYREAQLADKDFVISQDQFENLSDDEKRIYNDAHWGRGGMISFGTDNTFECNNQIEYAAAVAAGLIDGDLGYVDLGDVLPGSDGEGGDAIDKYMHDHHHKLNPNIDKTEQFMKHYINDNSDDYDAHDIKAMDNSTLHKTFMKIAAQKTNTDLDTLQRGVEFIAGHDTAGIDKHTADRFDQEDNERLARSNHPSYDVDDDDDEDEDDDIGAYDVAQHGLDSGDEDDTKNT